MPDPTTKNLSVPLPLRDITLTFDDIVPEREIIVFNVHSLRKRRGTVLAAPFRVRGPAGKTSFCFTLLLENGKTEDLFASDCGVTPNWTGWWNTHNFTIDAGDEDRLPTTPKPKDDQWPQGFLSHPLK